MHSLIRKLETHRYEIAVFGRVGSGKSSLINRLLEIQLLPVGTTPITAVPIHIVYGREPRLQVTFADRTETARVEDLSEYATEQQNPGNIKRVIRLEVMVPSRRLQDGVAFVDTPGIASLATIGTRLTYAYLPDCDFGIVLVDGQSTIGHDDLDILRALHMAGIPSMVMISKCDLLSDPNIDKVLNYTRTAIDEHLGFPQEVIAISTVESWAHAVNQWFEQTIFPLLTRARESLVISMNRKLLSLRNSLLATLQLRASRKRNEESNAGDLEQLLRPIDEALEEFERRWNAKLATIAECKKEALDNAAAQMAREFSRNREVKPQYESILSDALVRSLMDRITPFLAEYQSLSETISRQIRASARDKPEAHSQYYEPPKVSGLPVPAVSLLAGIKISDPTFALRATQATRERHFRRELRDKALERLDRVLQEYTPRLRHWLLSSIHALKNSYHMQTDPLRYRSRNLHSPNHMDNIADDIKLLRALFTETQPSDVSSS